jgi:hypothetical protein
VNSTSGTHGSGTSDATAKARTGKSRRRKWMLVPLILFIGIFVLLLMRNSLIWPRVAEQIEKDFKVTIELKKFDLAPTLNGLVLTGLSIRDLTGREIVRLNSFEVQFGLIGALFGSTEVSVDVSGLEVTAWEESEGVFNFAQLERAKPGTTTTVESAPKISADSESQPASSSEGGFEFDFRSLVRLDQIQLNVLEYQDGELVPAFESITLNTDLDAIVEFGADGSVQADVAKFDSDSQFHTGSLSGKVELPGGDSSFLLAFESLSGLWSIQPSRIQEAFGIELPAQFTKEARETLEFGISGSISSTELPGMLSDLDGQLRLGLDGCTIEGLTLNGDLDTNFVAGAIELVGKFDVNEGTIDLDGRIVPSHSTASAADPAFKTALLIDHVRIGSESSALLALLHPAFAKLKDSDLATVDAVADAQITLSYGAPIPWEILGEEELELLLGPFSADGSLVVEELVIEGSEFLDKLCEELGGSSDARLQLRPVSFELKNSRLRYAEPWTWTIADSETSFDGSVGLDQSLDLVWHVPITDGLVKRHRVLRKLKGKQLDVPITGTASDPKIDFGSVIAKAGESLLDGFLPNIGGGGDNQGETPEGLLKSANELWDAERFAEAAAIYSRIRSEYKLTLLYTLNRKLIKKRSSFTE